MGRKSQCERAVRLPIAKLKESVCTIKNSIEEHSRKNVYLVPFFNFLFYIGFFPFKVEFDQTKNKYVEKSNIIQQVLCALSNTGSLLLMTYWTAAALVKIISHDTVKMIVVINILDVVSNIGLVATTAFVVHVGWCRKTIFLELIENTRVTCVRNKKQRVICGLVYCCSILLLICFGILDWLLVNQYGILDPFTGSANYSSSTPENIPKTQSFGDGNFFQNFGGIQKLDETNAFMACIKRIAMVLIIFVYIYLTVFYSVCHAIFVLVALTLRQIGGEFRRMIKLTYDENSIEGLQQGIRHYKNLKQLTNGVKTVFGNSMIGYYISAVAYLAEAPHVLLGKRGDFERLIMIYSALSIIIWIFAAEFHDSVRNDLLKWAEYHFEKEDLSTDNRLQLLAIISEVSSNDATPVAMSNKCFSVTYKHISSMLSLIVTYGIIVFQLHHGHFSSHNTPLE